MAWKKKESKFKNISEVSVGSLACFDKVGRAIDS
jgi:hypothetical protein